MDPVVYVIVPRSRLYYIEAHYGGARRLIACFRDEGQAIRCLRELETEQDEIERRRSEIDSSRWNSAKRKWWR
jgi:hypothetical protein